MLVLCGEVFSCILVIVDVKDLKMSTCGNRLLHEGESQQGGKKVLLLLSERNFLSFFYYLLALLY